MILAEVFWKAPNLYDVLSVAGLVIGIASVWFSWWLAKRDLKKRIDDAAGKASAAARDEIRRIAQSHVANGLGDVIRWLELAREASKAKRWTRTGELCQLASEKLSEVIGQPTTEGTVRTELRPLAVILREIIAKLDKQEKPGTGTLQPATKQKLDETIENLNRLNGTLKGIRLENDNG